MSFVREDDQAITEKLNQVYSANVATLDPGLYGAQITSLPKEDWG